VFAVQGRFCAAMTPGVAIGNDNGAEHGNHFSKPTGNIRTSHERSQARKPPRAIELFDKVDACAGPVDDLSQRASTFAILVFASHQVTHPRQH
jgi:hypothetical protein